MTASPAISVAPDLTPGQSAVLSELLRMARYHHKPTEKSWDQVETLLEQLDAKTHGELDTAIHEWLSELFDLFSRIAAPAVDWCAQIPDPIGEIVARDSALLTNKTSPVLAELFGRAGIAEREWKA